MTSLSPDPQAHLSDLIEQINEALDCEIRAQQQQLARRKLADPITGVSGRFKRNVGPGNLYQFQLPGRKYKIREEDRVGVRLEHAKETLAAVRRFDRRTGMLEVVTTEWLGRDFNGADLEFDATWLLERLKDRLHSLTEYPEAFYSETVLRVLGCVPPDVGTSRSTLPTSEGLNRPQSEALERILGSDYQLVWGPPGTGKTRLVVRVVLELATEGPVLVCAATNGAVDVIARQMERVAPRHQVEANRIIRVGYDDLSGPVSLEFGAALARRVAGGARGLDDRLRKPEGEVGLGEQVELGSIAPVQNPYARLGRIQAAARRKGRTEMKGELQKIRWALQEEAIAMLGEADVILTTFAQIAAREELQTLRFTSLAIDEASTARLADVVLAASHARKRVVAVGDFRQLPAVVLSDEAPARRWLATDLFRQSGAVTDRGGSFAAPSRTDQLVAMLDLQYRMAPPIRRLVSECFYEGRLRDAPEITNRPSPMFRDTELRLMDTTELRPTTKKVYGSRANAVHAEVVAQFLEHEISRGVKDIAVVAPYRPHATQLWKLVRARLGEVAPDELEISTIHRFQGREKQLIVFDTVDAPPAPSWFLNDAKNRDLPRLLNVAFSRAQEGIAVIATVSGLRRTLPRNALLNRMIEHILGVGRVLSPVTFS